MPANVQYPHQGRLPDRRISAKIPFGYDLATDGQTLTPNSEEQELIRIIQSKSAEGKGVRLIAKALNETGAKSKTRGILHPSTVKGILDRQQKLAA